MLLQLKSWEHKFNKLIKFYNDTIDTRRYAKLIINCTNNYKFDSTYRNIACEIPALWRMGEYSCYTRD